MDIDVEGLKTVLTRIRCIDATLSGSIDGTLRFFRLSRISCPSVRATYLDSRRIADLSGILGLGILSFVPVATGSSHNVNSKHEAAWIFMNVATNVMVTALISFHLLITRSSLSQIIPSKQLTLYHGVVAILIESALPLSVFGVIYASMLVGTVQEETKSLAMFDSARTVFSFLYYAFTVSLRLPCYSASELTLVDPGYCTSSHHFPNHDQPILGEDASSSGHLRRPKHGTLGV